MTRYAVWNGTAADLKVLEAAAMRNCTCDEPASNGCPAHLMLSDQKILDHLAAVKFDLKRFKRAEWKA